jgi:nucleotidyltransferase/DNA polymerase involved in DNA repair
MGVVPLDPAAHDPTVGDLQSVVAVLEMFDWIGTQNHVQGNCLPMRRPISMSQKTRPGTATATKVASNIRQQIREELNLTASACVAPNKFLAKMPPIGAIRMVCS